MPPAHGELPALDAHAHLDEALPAQSFAASGFVLAQTMSLAQAERALGRTDAAIAWGVGCHPRLSRAQDAFAADSFERLVAQTPVIGEVGLDAGSRVPAATQLRTLRAILDRARAQPRIVSLHSFRSTGALLDELERRPLSAPILHWWRGRSDETQRAVRLGCYFSLHSAVAHWSIFRRHVPMDRLLIESDHGEKDPPAAIPLRVGWVEHLVGQQYGVSPSDIREVAWRNLAQLVGVTHTGHLFPQEFCVELTRH
jgi:TatD DNase family protein